MVADSSKSEYSWMAGVAPPPSEGHVGASLPGSFVFTDNWVQVCVGMSESCEILTTLVGSDTLPAATAC